MLLRYFNPIGGENRNGFYGSVVGSDKKSVMLKAAMLSIALQAKCPYLSPACAFISLTDFMESLMAGGGDGSSDSFHVDFLEPKRNMIYILDGNQNLKILSVNDIPLVKRL